MIPRYSRPELTNIWSDQARYKIWFEVEAYACEALAAQGQGIVPTHIPDKIWSYSGREFDIVAINEHEKKVHHDVIAFLTYLSDIIGEDAKYLHFGMTSSDVVDTAFSVQLKKSCDHLLNDIKNVLHVMKSKAMEYKELVCVGRSHGIHAEPMVFGMKFASMYSEFLRHYHRLVNAKNEISVCAISGAVGTYAHLNPQVEAFVAEKLGLRPENISTQVIPRDRHAYFFTTLAVIASSVERIAVEIRHLQRTEVAEVYEPFRDGQKGSSAMPHKRNPILSENITGLARLVRAWSIAAMENVALWHERDISHSSVERVIAPDSTITMDFMLARLTEILNGINVVPENITANLDTTGGLIYSQSILLALISKGVTREDAYSIVQSNSKQVWQGVGDFLTITRNDPRIQSLLSPEEVNKITDRNYCLQNIDTVFDRVFSEQIPE